MKWEPRKDREDPENLVWGLLETAGVGVNRERLRQPGVIRAARGLVE